MFALPPSSPTNGTPPMKHHKKPRATRRDFLATAAATVACPYIITSAALGADGRPPASDRLVVAGIGIGNQGSEDQKEFVRRSDVQYVAMCDVKKGEQQEKGRNLVNDHYKNSDCKVY